MATMVRFSRFLVLAIGLMSSLTPAIAWDSHALIALARSAVKAEVEGKVPPKPATKSPARPVFVTIEIEGRVAGCRGSLAARTGSLEEEVILAARAAAKHDPRYAPLSPKDIPRILVTVTVVNGTQPLDDVNSLTPADGLVLKSGAKVGVVLPWEGKDPKIRLGWAYRKAGVKPGTSVRLYKLKAERYRG